MMVIAVITTKSGFAPLIEGLCAQISYLDLRLSVFVFTSFAFLFRKKKYVKEKSSQYKISSRLSAYAYTCVLCTHVRIYVCRDLVHLDSSGPPGVSSRLLGSHPSTPSVQCVCVCVHTHTRTPTYTPTRVKNREDTDNTPIFPSVKKKWPPTPSNKCFHRLAELRHPRSLNAKWNKPHIHERICTSCNEREANVYADVLSTFLTYRSAHA